MYSRLSSLLPSWFAKGLVIPKIVTSKLAAGWTTYGTSPAQILVRRVSIYRLVISPIIIRNRRLLIFNQKLYQPDMKSD
jgi:hypothetical protein